MSKVAGLIGLAFPPATFGLGLAKLATNLTEKQYARWYARVMDEEYSPAKFEPDRLDPAAAHTLINQSPLWKAKIGNLSNRTRVQGIVKAALAPDEGETLWNDADFGVQPLFTGDRAAFDAAVDELRKQAQKVGVDLDLSNVPNVEGTEEFGGNLGIMKAVDKVRHSSADKIQVWLDVLMTTLQWYKDNGKGIEQIIDQFKSAHAQKKGKAT